MGGGLITRASWRCVAASVAGAGHVARSSECEDASAVETHEGSLLLAVADGAGSARLARNGSRLAVAVALEELRVRAGDDLCPSRLHDVVAAVRVALEPAPEDDPGTELGDRATTLLLARWRDDVIETAQVGDGAIVVRRNGELEVICADRRGEYLNETCFVTSSSWESELRTGVVSAAGVDAIAGMTDGLQLLAFDLATGTPHQPFFAPFFAFADGGGSTEDLAAFLGSDRVAGRTDDDVTLAIAVAVHNDEAIAPTTGE